MNEELLNMEIRKYLKNVGVTSQREIEHAVINAISTGILKGTESININMTLTISEIGLNHSIKGAIALE